MATNFTLSFSSLSFFVLLLSFNIGENMAQDVPSGMKTWCVAKPSASDTELKNNIDYVCRAQGLPCNKHISYGAPCYDPNSLINHASVVMNLYFQTQNRLTSACDFKGSGLVVLTDPSFRTCSYNEI